MTPFSWNPRSTAGTRIAVETGTTAGATGGTFPLVFQSAGCRRSGLTKSLQSRSTRGPSVTRPPCTGSGLRGISPRRPGHFLASGAMSSTVCDGLAACTTGRHGTAGAMNLGVGIYSRSCRRAGRGADSLPLSRSRQFELFRKASIRWRRSDSIPSAVVWSGTRFTLGCASFRTTAVHGLAANLSGSARVLTRKGRGTYFTCGANARALIAGMARTDAGGAIAGPCIRIAFSPISACERDCRAGVIPARGCHSTLGARATGRASGGATTE